MSAIIYMSFKLYHYFDYLILKLWYDSHQYRHIKACCLFIRPISLFMAILCFSLYALLLKVMNFVDSVYKLNKIRIDL